MLFSGVRAPAKRHSTVRLYHNLDPFADLNLVIHADGAVALHKGRHLVKPLQCNLLHGVDVTARHCDLRPHLLLGRVVIWDDMQDIHRHCTRQELLLHFRQRVTWDIHFLACVWAVGREDEAGEVVIVEAAEEKANALRAHLCKVVPLTSGHLLLPTCAHLCEFDIEGGGVLALLRARVGHHTVNPLIHAQNHAGAHFIGEDAALLCKER
ncbi:hypothetical protein, conserved [Leishmania tarentolae]|uniref:Uncharacterized protein n=1 Tax=Leishmania tarentolae TaxID=5689 RepID=A0A640KJ63_LEITA|nr:hypothetical protein, conserved [Leishmania tarentolae]